MKRSKGKGDGRGKSTGKKAWSDRKMFKKMTTLVAKALENMVGDKRKQESISGNSAGDDNDDVRGDDYNLFLKGKSIRNPGYICPGLNSLAVPWTGPHWPQCNAIDHDLAW